MVSGSNLLVVAAAPGVLGAGGGGQGRVPGTGGGRHLLEVVRSYLTLTLLSHGQLWSLKIANSGFSPPSGLLIVSSGCMNDGSLPLK